MYSAKFRLVKWHEKSFHTYVIKLFINLSTLSFIFYTFYLTIYFINYL